jgi:hypothetical protein
MVDWFESRSAAHSSTIIACPLVVDIDIIWTDVAIPLEISLSCLPHKGACQASAAEREERL